MARIGIVGKNYNTKRQIYSHDHEFHTFHSVIDFSQVIQRVGGMLPLSIYNLNNYSIRRVPPRFPKVDLLHLFNCVAEGNTPWIVTTSIGFGRGNGTNEQKRHMELLASDACKRIICSSIFAYDKQVIKANEWQEYEQAILSKMLFLPPPQQLVVKNFREKLTYVDNEIITFSIVGNPIFFKGGLEVLRVFARLINLGTRIRLNVVSNFQLDGVFGRSELQQKQAKEIIEGSDGITLYSDITNNDVLEILKRTHVGLLPSFSETYGNSVLEAQACGCPVITTDINAFTEINPLNCGWQIKISDDYDIDSQVGIQKISNKIESGLTEIIEQIIASPSDIAKKSKMAMKRIKEYHEPSRHKRQLSTIYEEITCK